MSKQHRTKHIKSLEEQLATTNDPKIKADLSRQLTKLLSKPTRKGASRKPVAIPSSKKPSLLTRVNGNGVDWLSPEKKLIHFVFVEFEKRRKDYRQRTGQELTEVETKALMRESGAFIEGQLTEEDRALLAVENTEK
jgi:hypothetical protein